VNPTSLPRLELRLLDSSMLLLDDFPAFAEQTVELGSVRATLRVIGASSLVIVQSASLVLVELIACGTPVSASLAAAAVAGRPGASSAVAVARNGFSYSARLWTARLGDERATTPYPHLVEHRFPGPGSPLTRIEAGEWEGMLHLRTRHDYPEAETVVWSESEWRFP
jgi:hypothetical protein